MWLSPEEVVKTRSSLKNARLRGAVIVVRYKKKKKIRGICRTNPRYKVRQGG